MLRLTLLGGFDARHDEIPLPRLQQERLQSLLACLLLSPNGPIARRELASRLWPDTTDAQARTNLRTLLTRLRDALPEPDRYLALDALTAGVRADAPIESDLAVFESALRQIVAARQDNRTDAVVEALQTAIAAYSGDLLPGCYDEWILPERERLRQAYEGALAALIELLRLRGDYRSAIEQARRLLRADPLHEPAYRELMRLHLATGNRAGALRAYHACASILRNELGADPAPETDALHLEVLRLEGAPAPATTPAAAHPDLVGRDVPWALLTAAWRQAAQGKPQFILLSGEAGIGKTRLAEDLIAWIERQEQPVAVARCYAGQADVPYAPVAQWLAAPAIRQRLAQLETPWLVEVSRLATWLHVERPDLPAPGPLTEAWQRQRLFEALVRALSGPGAFFLDDVQWCDRDTLDWLGYWLRSALHAPFLLIGTARAEEIIEGHPLTDLRLSLAQAGLGTDIPLTRLDLRQTVSVGATLLGRELSAAEAEQLYRDAEGVPLFIVEIARAGLSGEARIARPDTPSEPGETGALPPVMRAVIEYRLARLSARAREAAQTAAVIGREFNAGVLALAMGKPQDDLVAVLDELWQRQIIREQGADAYDFSHDKIRQVAYTGLSRARRRRLHHDVAEALCRYHASDLDGVSAQIGWHFEQAGDQDRAIPMYRRAVKAARQVYANDEAIRVLELLLQGDLAARITSTDAVEIMLELGEIWRTVGRWAEAEKITREALDRAEKVGSASLKPKAQQALADVMRLQGRYDEALVWLVKAQDGFEHAGDQAGLIRTLWTMGEIYWYQGNHDQALAALGRQLEMVTQIGDERGVCEALGTIGMIYWSQGDFDQSQGCCDRAIALANTIGHRHIVGRTANVLGNIGLGRRNYAFAFKWSQVSYEVALEVGDRQGLAWALHTAAKVFAELGDFQRAFSYDVFHLHTLSEIGDRWSTSRGIYDLGWILRRLDYARYAEETYRQAIALGKELGMPGFLSDMSHDLAELLLEQQRLDEANRVYEEAQASAASVKGGWLAGEDVRFNLSVLSVRLRYAQGYLSQSQAVTELERLLSEWPSLEQQAKLHFDAWRINSSLETHRISAAEKYRVLAVSTSGILYRHRYHELTGEWLPAPPPLPDLPGVVVQIPVDIESLMTQLRAVLTRLRRSVS